jgi:hypothetical protein
VCGPLEQLQDGDVGIQELETTGLDTLYVGVEGEEAWRRPHFQLK